MIPVLPVRNPCGCPFWSSHLNSPVWNEGRAASCLPEAEAPGREPLQSPQRWASFPKQAQGLSLLGQPQALFLPPFFFISLHKCSTFLFTVVILDKMLHLSEDWAAVRVNRRKTLSLKHNLQEPGNLRILTNKWFQWCSKFAKHCFVNVTAHLEAC